jgi:asparagine synthase (glutamine-hydrolysing)
MAFSIEARQPFLDVRVVEHAFSIPSHFKMKDGLNKYILRKAFEDVVPEKIKGRYQKKGFQSGASLWFRREQKDRIENIFHSHSFKQRGYFNNKEVLKEWDLHGRGQRDYHEKICSWLLLELWFRRFIDSAASLRVSEKDFFLAVFINLYRRLL